MTTPFLIIFSIILFLFGIVVGWVIAASRARNKVVEYEQDKIRAEARLEGIEDQRKLLEAAQEKLATTFQALSGESLKSNNEAFLQLAKESLDKVVAQAKGQFGEKEESIKGIVGSLDDALKEYQKHIKDFEEKRSQDYGSLDAQIKTLAMANQELQKETGNLVNALRRPEVRGHWGEVTLKRVVELAGMTEHCDFTEQVSVNSSEGRMRPDMIVHLPGGREIVVDSKVPLDSYLNAVNEEDLDAKTTAFKKHAEHVRQHMKSLSLKAYWDQFQDAPEFVVMFIPGESFLSVALGEDHMLIEDGMESKVILATPTTLVALLRAIAFGWRQEQIAKNAQEIANLGQEIFERFKPFLEHINSTGDHLSKATVSFNKMIMSLERRVMVSVRKFKELGAAGEKELPEINPIEQTPMVTDTKEESKEKENEPASTTS